MKQASRRALARLLLAGYKRRLRAIVEAAILSWIVGIESC